MAGLYFHIPFCKQACHYCDFHFSTNRSTQGDLVRAILSELEIQKNYGGGEPLKTIYFGGGTPSLLAPEELEAIFQAIRDHYIVNPDAEITLEGNPDDLNFEQLSGLRKAGVNRLSIGIQSFHDKVLKYLNRAHSSISARQSVADARLAGFNNISIDLIYAIPDLGDDVWKEDIRQAIALSPEHISSYSLTIEEKTVFGYQAARGKLIPTSDDTSARHLEILMAELGQAGYEHYEISNFARPGFRSRHNSSYWQQQKYIGIGPSAHSYNGDSRQFNIANNAGYVRALAQGKIPYQLEILSRNDHINEFLLTTLRTSWGCDAGTINSKYDYDLLTHQREYLNRMTANGMITVEGNHIRLTQRGKLMADKIASDLFVITD